MANELNIQLDPFTETGLTLIGKVKSLSGVQQGSDVAMTETSSSGQYTGDFNFALLADGDYVVSFETISFFYGSGELLIKDSQEVKTSDPAGIADGILIRSIAGGSNGGRTIQDALRSSRNRVVIDTISNTITVYEEDDSTVAWTGVIATGARNPINSVNPA